ncbi:MAG TPA: SH3 domain-containing protein [Aquifex aeolicus]|nr:SH3 domain-containing protein [Aquifex aeolicus]
MNKYAVLSFLILTLSFPSGYLTGAVIDESELILRAVYKLIEKVSFLEKRIKKIEEEIKKLSLKKDGEVFIEMGVKSKYLVTATKLRIRRCPSFSCTVLGYFRKGDIVEELKTFGEWKKVRSVSGGKEGWVYEKYLLPY